MDDTRDKVIALEVKVEQMALDMKRLADAVENLNSLLDQARGAKWALSFLLFAGGGHVDLLAKCYPVVCVSAVKHGMSKYRINSYQIK